MEFRRKNGYGNNLCEKANVSMKLSPSTRGSTKSLNEFPPNIHKFSGVDASKLYKPVFPFSVLIRLKGDLIRSEMGN